MIANYTKYDILTNIKYMIQLLYSHIQKEYLVENLLVLAIILFILFLITKKGGQKSHDEVTMIQKTLEVRQVKIPKFIIRYSEIYCYPGHKYFKVIVMYPNEEGESVVAVGGASADHIQIASSFADSFRTDDAMLAFTVGYENNAEAAGGSISGKLISQSEKWVTWFSEELLKKIEIPLDWQENAEKFLKRAEEIGRMRNEKFLNEVKE